MTPSVELLWWDGCPSTAKAHELLREVLAAEGLDPEGVELREVGTHGEAENEGFVGSPTIRINGMDVAPVASEAVGLTCRIYHLRDGRVSPAPDPDDIRQAIRKAVRK